MKSIPTQIAEARERNLAKGYTEVQLTEAVKECVNEEHRLSVMLSLEKKKPVAESGRQRIERKNGTGTVEMTESDKSAERVRNYQKKFKVTLREAHVLCGLKDPGANVESAVVIAERAARWKKYAPGLTEQEYRTLAEKNIEP
jgi:hypothetical protein